MESSVCKGYKKLYDRIEKEVRSLEGVQDAWDRDFYEQLLAEEKLGEEAYLLYDELLSCDGSDILCGLAQGVTRSLDGVSGDAKTIRHALKGVRFVIENILKESIYSRYNMLYESIEEIDHTLKTDKPITKRKVVEEAYRLYEDLVLYSGHDILCGLAHVVALSLDGACKISGNTTTIRHALGGIQTAIKELLSVQL